MKLRELAAILGGTVIGDPETEVTRCASLENAGNGAITHIERAKYLPALEQCGASAVIVPPGLQSRLPSIVVDLPALAFAKTLDILHPPKIPAVGRHPSAAIHPSVKIGEACHIGAAATIGENSVIGGGCIIHPSVAIGEGVTIGGDCIMYPNVVIYPGTVIGGRAILHAGCVIGGDGFKYVPDASGGRVKVRHIGIVRIGNDVEIGANSCVDRAALDETVIGDGVKIDNLVQIGHNCVIGAGTVIAGSCGVSGSVRIGKNCILGGQVGVADHVTIADNVIIAAKSGVTGDLDKPGIYGGMPAHPVLQWRKEMAAFARGPETLKRLAKLEKDGRS